MEALMVNQIISSKNKVLKICVLENYLGRLVKMTDGGDSTLGVFIL